jgi:protoporphyrinogen oxidase
MRSEPHIVIGAGPAGLAAAYELAQHDQMSLVLEASDKLGGLARTEEYKGYRFDIGGHRFYTRVPEIQALWQRLLGDEFIQVERLSRIYYRKRFFQYPISLVDTLVNLGAAESLLILLSYLKARLLPHREEKSLEEWMTNRFGSRLYRAFFKTYTEKVWGMPCTALQADWAAQRIQDLTLSAAVLAALKGSSRAKTLIHSFHYPRLGPGEMWERMHQEIVLSGSDLWRNAPVLRVQHADGRVHAVVVSLNGGERAMPCQQVISSMPLSQLVLRLEPSPPADIVADAAALRYRAFVIVALVVDAPALFPDNWIYVHSPDVRVGRIQNFKNWSLALVAEPRMTSLGMEYFCDQGDALWRTPDAELIALATRELGELGLAQDAPIVEAVVIRQPGAYPVYDCEYRERVARLRGYLSTFSNLQTVGRNGLHRYNNLDHSMLTGILAARNVLGEKHDIWAVNTDQTYGESGAAVE